MRIRRFIHQKEASARVKEIVARAEKEKNTRIICLDYAQLELRVATLFHRDPAMSKILNDPKGDLHTHTANEFGVDRDPTAKQINFLLVYGGGDYMLGRKLTTEGVPTTQEQAGGLINRYNQVYARVRPWRKGLLDEHQDNGFVKLFTGRKRSLGDIDWSDKRELHKAETTLANNTVQGSGQDFLKASIIRSDPKCINPDRVTLGRLTGMKADHIALLKDYAFRLEKYRRMFEKANLHWLLQVHDESLWRCDKEAAGDMGIILSEIMTWHHYLPAIRPYSVPLVADGGIGETWKRAKAAGKSKTPNDPNKLHYFPDEP